MEKIESVTIVTGQGVKVYSAGGRVGRNDAVISVIKKVPLHFQGESFDHYVGYDEHGKMLFSVNCLCPCDIVYQ